MEQPRFPHDHEEDLFLGRSTQEEAALRFNKHLGDWYLTPEGLVIYRFGPRPYQYTCGYLSSWIRIFPDRLAHWISLYPGATQSEPSRNRPDGHPD